MSTDRRWRERDLLALTMAGHVAGACGQQKATSIPQGRQTTPKAGCRQHQCGICRCVDVCHKAPQARMSLELPVSVVDSVISSMISA